MHDDRNSISCVVRMIQCEVSYLEDAPDEMLAPFRERLGAIAGRLVRMAEPAVSGPAAGNPEG